MRITQLAFGITLQADGTCSATVRRHELRWATVDFALGDIAVVFPASFLFALFRSQRKNRVALPPKAEKR
jgi:hypothetical protein